MDDYAAAAAAPTAPPNTPHLRISSVTTMDDSAAATPSVTPHPGISSVTTMNVSAAAAAAATAEEAPKEDPQTLARWYQLEALERAVGGNTVTFLETGAGKTLIAVLLLRSYAHRVRRPARDFAVFLVPTVVLVEQQARVVEAHTDLRVHKFFGAMGVDLWDAATWGRVVDDAEVLVMTPQILLDNLRHSFFLLKDIALLIFDECHHAKGDSQYACILKRLQEKHLEVLEGSLYGSSLENAKQRISKLHRTFLYCTANLGVWLAAKAAEVQSTKEKLLSFWGEKIDKNVEAFIRKYCEEVYRELSCFSKRGHIGEDFAADMQDGLLTPKVHCLIQSLLEYRHMEDLRCIVFVERVITSIVLESLLSTISQMSGWTIKYMAGDSSTLHPQSRKKHTEIVDSFRSGKVHLIVATQVLEEGLDVPSCNLIIRFDPPATVCSFIQSRGRARMQNSDYVLLVRRGDAEALSKTEKFLASGQIMREESLRLASTLCQPLENTLCEEDYYRVESTGAIVTINSSVPLIYFFCSKLPFDESVFVSITNGFLLLRFSGTDIICFSWIIFLSARYYKPLPRFTINKALRSCILHLPKSSPVQTVYIEGEVSVLKKAVCLKACRELHTIGALTDSLLPELGVPWEEEPDIVVEKYQEEQADYYPEEFVDNWFSFSRLGIYYCYTISLEGYFKTTASPTDILLAVKCELGPDFILNTFKLCGAQDYVNVSMKYAGIVHLNQEQVTMARRFQATILSLLVNKNHCEGMNAIKYFHEMEVTMGVVYLLLPLVSGKVDWCSIKFSASQAYEASNKDTKHCHSCEEVDLVQTKDGPLCRCMLKKSIVYTPHNMELYAVTEFLELNATSLLHLRDGSVITYITYFKTRYGLSLTHKNQPLLAGSKLVEVRNFLHKRHYYENKKESCSSYAVELPPELCRVVMSPVSASTLCSFSIIPSVMYRIQCILLSAKLKVQLGPRMQQFVIPSLKILEAITTKECQEEFSQESLETLGDSFLKYVTTQHLYSKYKLHHEGTLTKMKKNLISNAALCQLACNYNLVGYIQGEEFKPKGWIIPGLGYDTCGSSKQLSLSSSGMYSLRKMSLRSKRIADTVEALIGAYLSAAGEQAAFLFLKSLGMDIEFHSKILGERTVVIKSEEFINVRSLETILGYEFKDPLLLMEALTHGSYQIAGTTACYQRLEFLGDAVLDHLFTVYFYNQYPECTPALLTDLRSASVNNYCYAHASVKAGLNKHILHSSSELHRKMAYYLEKFGQSFTGPSHGWEAGIGLPKVLGDVIESIAGAIYIDSKYDKEVVWKSMKQLLEPLATPETVECDPVKELQEYCDRRSCRNSYTTTHKDGVSSVVAEVQVEGTIYSATQTGPDKSVAKKYAAKLLLKDLKDAVL